MTFSLRSIITRLFAAPKGPLPEIVIGRSTWGRLIAGLRARGDGRRESGAFLLGPTDGARTVTDIVFYDEIDPHAFDTGIIVLDGSLIGSLWRVCRERRLRVVADVHTHPGSAGQSESDRRHPMVAERGHVAIILPDFATPPIEPEQIGVFRYLGKFRWLRLDNSAASPALAIEGR